MEIDDVNCSQQQEMIMSFNLGQIDHPRYGKSDQIIGELQFVLPPGIYKHPTILKEPDSFLRAIKLALPTCREYWPDLLDQQIIERVKEYAFATALMTKLDLCEPRGIALLYVYIIAFTLDDFVSSIDFDNDSNIDMSGSSNYKEFLKFMETTDFMNLNAETMPSFNLDVEVFRNFMIKCQAHEKSCNLPQPGEKEMVEFMNALKSDFSAAFLVKDLTNNAGLCFSCATSLQYDRYLRGARSMLEYTAICHEVVLSSTIRNDILFQALLNNWSDIITLVNAILGLPRDVERGRETGPLMRLVVIRKLGLQEAFENVYSQLQDAYRDYKICSRKLLAIYDSDETVGQYIELMGKMIDGSIFGYQGAKRYGLQDKMKVEVKLKSY